MLNARPGMSEHSDKSKREKLEESHAKEKEEKT